MKKILAVLLLCVLLPAFAGADLEAHFLSVGQGDCTVILCDGEAMVIDGGPRAFAGYVYSYIRRTLKLRHLDYVISTHPDNAYDLSTVLNAENADETVYVCDHYHRGVFQQRNTWMVDRSSRVIAVYSGAPGGTKNTVDYAERKGMELVRSG